MRLARGQRRVRIDIACRVLVVAGRRIVALRGGVVPARGVCGLIDAGYSRLARGAGSSPSRRASRH